MIFPPGRLPTDRTWPYDDPTTSLEGTTMTTDDQPTPTLRANRARMRDARYLTGELAGVPPLSDLHGRRFSPQHFRATWERQGGEEWPWELRVTVQGHAVLKDGSQGQAVRSLVYEDDTQAVPMAEATFRLLPDWMARELADFAPHPVPQTPHLEQPGLGTLHGFVSGE